MAQHVLFIVNNYPPHLGGVEMHVSSLANALVELGHRVTVATTASSNLGMTDERGVSVLRIAGRFGVGEVLSFPPPGTAKALRNYATEEGVTAISTHTRFFPMSTVGAGTAKAAGIPHVHTEHGSDFVRGVSAPVALASRLVDESLGKRVLRRADTVLAVSDGVEAFVTRLAGVTAIPFPNAIHTEPWAAGRLEPRETSTRRLVYLGRLVPGKGWEAFLSSIRILTDRGADVTGELIGDGPDRHAAAELVARLGLANLVSVRGRLDGEDLVRALSGATLVNATTLSEGFQTSLLETIAAGGDVVTYPVPGARVLVERGAPVVVTNARTAESLADAIQAQPPGRSLPVAQLQEWDWRTRSREFVDVLEASGAPRQP